MTSAFDHDAALRRTGDTAFMAGAPDRWRSAVGRPAGGLIAAQMMMAMIETVGDGSHHPRAITTHLMRAPVEGDYEIETTIERSGRTITNVSARCTQGGKLQAMALAVFGSDRTGHEFDELPMPDIAPPTPGRPREAFYPEFAHPFAYQLVAQPRSGGLPFRNEPMHNAGWVGFTDPRPFDAPGLLVLADAGMMPWWNRLDEMAATATVDYTVHFRADFPRSYPDELAVIENRTRYVRDGLLDWDSVIWGPDGTVLCLSRQQLVTL